MATGLGIALVLAVLVLVLVVVAFSIWGPGAGPSPPRPELAVEGGDGRVTLSGYDAVATAGRWQYQQKPVGGAFGGWREVPEGRVVKGLANGWAYSFRVRAVSGPGDEIVVQPSNEASVFLPQRRPPRLDFERLLKEQIASEVCPGADPVISDPIVFRRDQPVVGETRAPEAAAPEALAAFFDDEHRPRGSEVHVIGLASPDGDREYNSDLSRRRAEVVRGMVSAWFGDESEPPGISVRSWGEDHLTNGIANSRSVRLVSCVE